MGSRVAETGEDGVTHAAADKPVVAGDHLGDGPVVGGHDLAQFLGIEP